MTTRQHLVVSTLWTNKKFFQSHFHLLRALGAYRFQLYGNDLKRLQASKKNIFNMPENMEIMPFWAVLAGNFFLWKGRLEG